VTALSRQFDAPLCDEDLAPSLASGATAATILLVGFGTFGGLLFTMVYTLEGFTRVGYSTVAEPISALSLGAGGWLQRANFITFGILFAVSAIGWRRLLQRGKSSVSFPVTRGVVGIGLIIDGLVSPDAVNGFPPGVATATPSLHGTIHDAAATAVILGLAVSSFLLARRLWSDTDLHAWSIWSAITGLLTIIFITGFGMSGGSGGLSGIFERLSGAVNSAFGLAILIRLTGFIGGKKSKYERSEHLRP
jgi:hypothetical protein